MDIVTTAKPAQHGRRLDGKRVIIEDTLGKRLYGVYYTIDSRYFMLLEDNPMDNVPRYKKRWTVEEIIERKER